MLLDGDDLLLRDEAVPAAQRLGVGGGIAVVGCHVGTHDPGGVARDIQAGQKPVLEAHARYGLGGDAAEFIAPAANEGCRLIDT